jgi:colanic acid/amylovoran biosynthesis protein
MPMVIPDTPLDRSVRNASLVISNGGLYFGFPKTNIINMLYHLIAFSYPMLLALRLDIPYVLFSQSFGPFPSRLSQRWLKLLVNRSTGTWCRETLSCQTLRALEVDESVLKTVPDAAFGLPFSHAAPEYPSPIPGLHRNEYVAISLRSLIPSGHTQALRAYTRTHLLS